MLQIYRVKRCEFADQQISDTNDVTAVEFEFLLKMEQQTLNLQIHSQPHMREVHWPEPSDQQEDLWGFREDELLHVFWLEYRNVPIRLYSIIDTDPGASSYLRNNFDFFFVFQQVINNLVEANFLNVWKNKMI